MENTKIEKRAWFYDLLFILVLLLAGYLRLAGSIGAKDITNIRMNCF